MSVRSKLHPSRLHVVCAISNPLRYESRYRLYSKFAKEMKTAGAQLLTVEAAFGDRPHEVTPSIHGAHVQVRSSHEVWLKECLWNIGVRHLPADWEYVLFSDADITFANPDWQVETVEALQHWPVVQPFETAIDLSPTGAAMATYVGLGANWAKGLPMGPGAGGTYGLYNHPGFAIAMTREAYDALGGLIDEAALGAGDHHQMLSLIGMGERSLPGGISKGYREMVLDWQERARSERLIGNLGYVPGTILHSFHGAKNKRRYLERWEILTRWQFDPRKDLRRNSHGVIELTAAGERLRPDLRRYFAERDEDCTAQS